MGLGLDPLGTDLGPFGGPGLITIKGVTPIGMSEIAIVFDRSPKLLGDGSFDDASDLSNYILVPLDPTELLPPDDKVFIPAGKFPPTHGAEIVAARLDPDDDKQVILVTDCALEKWVDYELTLLYVEGADGEDFAGPNAFPFRALTPGKQIIGKKAALSVPQDPFLDIHNTFGAADDGSASLQGWQLESSQQFVKKGGLENTRKRIVRRMFAGRGRYLVYSNEYGIDLRPKTLVRPGDLQRLENDLAAQIRREPDVRAASVTAIIDASGQMLNIEARVDVRVFGFMTVRQQVALP